MRNLTLIFLLLVASLNQAFAANQNQKLLCNGWTYIRDSSGVLLNPNNSNEATYSQLIDIDLSNMRISAFTEYGEIKSTLIVTDEAYYGDKAINIKIGDAEIDNIRVHVNRYTGKGFIFARSLDKTGGFTIFNGECKSQQKQF
jgi:hypothetical protein